MFEENKNLNNLGTSGHCKIPVNNFGNEDFYSSLKHRLSVVIKKRSNSRGDRLRSDRLPCINRIKYNYFEIIEEKCDEEIESPVLLLEKNRFKTPEFKRVL